MSLGLQQNLWSGKNATAKLTAVPRTSAGLIILPTYLGRHRGLSYYYMGLISRRIGRIGEIGFIGETAAAAFPIDMSAVLTYLSHRDVHYQPSVQQHHVEVVTQPSPTDPVLA